VLGLAQLTADAIDFGDVVVGESAAQTFSLVNNDKAVTDVHLSPVNGPSDRAFSSDLGAGVFTIKPDEQLLVTLRFRPQSVGPAQGQLLVTPCPTCPPRTVSLVGNGALRVVDVEPQSIDYGDVVAGTSAQAPIAFVSHAKQLITLGAATLAGNAPVRIDLDGGRIFPLALAPDERVTGTATFAPDSFGARSGRLTFGASDGAPPTLDVSGFSYGSQLTTSPQGFEGFAALTGTSRPTTLTLTNTGLDPKGLRPLVISEASLQGPDAASWSMQLPALPWTVGAPGAQGLVQLRYSPTAAGAGTASLVLRSNDAMHPSVTIPLDGVASDLPPCQAQLAPAAVDFGNVGIGRPTTAGFEIANVGASDCILGDPVLTRGEPAFHWPGYVAPLGRTLPPGGRTSVRVQFTADAARDYAGQVELYVSNKAAPKLTVPLHAHGDAGCFTVAPATLDFGGGHVGCGFPPQTAMLSNNCPAAITINSLSAPAPFGISGGPALPLALAPGQQLQATVTYAPQSLGDDDVALLAVATSVSPVPYGIGLTGAALADVVQTDQWDQSTPKVDLLIVMDNSGSMAEEQAALTQNLDRLWNRIALADADFHIAVTTTGMYPFTAGWTLCPGGANGGEAGRFFPVDGSRPRLLTPQTPDVANVLMANLNVGLCHWDERFTEPVMAALTPPLSTSTAPDGDAGFLRDDARLALLAFSDADDYDDVPNPPVSVSQLVQTLRAVKNGALDLVSFAGIVALQQCATIESLGVRYTQIAAALNGHLEDICDLQHMGDLIDRSLDILLLPLTGFSLSAVPKDPTQIVVTVNGQPTTTFSYDPLSNRIVFPPGSVPPPGSHITATYEVACP
jgi:hypothetical protein